MEQVKKLQRVLGVDPDGDFGPKTAKAYKEYLNLDFSEAVHFLAQSMHESQGFKKFEENLNYSAKRLLEVFPKYFDEIQAKYAGNNPEAIGNKVYADRMGNGSVYTGDGYKHRGFGAIHLTGKNNQYKFADHVGDQRIKQNPKLIAEEYAFKASEWFFDENKIWRYCGSMETEFVMKVSRAVNLGNALSTGKVNGLQDRLKCYEKVKGWMRS